MVNVIKNILKDHWDGFYSHFSNDIRPVVIDEVNKLLHCKDFSFGSFVFICENCNKVHHVPFTCKSRFCSSCGSSYKLNRATSIKSKLINTYHRHIVFTIPAELRHIFAFNRDLLNILFRASADCILYAFQSKNKSQSFTPGIVSCIHTFGRDLKWNPHIHMLVSDVGLGNSTFRKFSHINFNLLRKSWQMLLLKYIKEYDSSLLSKKLINYLYSHYNQGFYIHAPKLEKHDSTATTNYIIRYIARPPIAESRIINYDGSNVTFCYNRHEDDAYVEETLPVFDFLKKLIRHIHDKYFNSLRYYGVYAKKHHLYPKMVKMFRRIKERIMRHFIPRIILSFGYDPLWCKDCKRRLNLSYIVRDGTMILPSQFNGNLVKQNNFHF